MIATAMSANVFFWIIPGQKKVIASLRAGEKPDPIHGWRGKQRSVHNTYFTLPVIIAMLSNHYGWLYQGQHNWIVLCLMMLGGALIRHSFAARHKAHVQGRRTPWEHAIVGTLVIAGVMAWLAPRKAAESGDAGNAQPATFQAVQSIVAERCVACHNAQLQSKNVALHTPALIRQHALAVYQQTAVLKLMPMNNATQISEAERSVIRRWFEAGAKAE
jgi:uncharacterized membrane protein